MTMTTQPPRLNIALSGAIRRNDSRTPAIARACAIVALIAAAIAFIGWSAIAMPEQPEPSYTTMPAADSIAEPATTSWPAPKTSETATSTQLGNVVDLTF
jgi:hypothetical protein